MSLFHQASGLNNRAITDLINGNDKVAVLSMSNCIHILRTELVKAEQTSCQQLTTPSPTHFSDAQVWKTVRIPHLTSGDEHHDIFDHAIQVPCCEHGGGDDSHEFEIRICAAAVIFNLALAHHRQGLRGGKGSFLKKAVNLYGVVLRVLDDSLIEFRVAVVPLIKLAAINNLIQIQLAIGDSNAADESLRRLVGTVRLANVEALTDPTLGRLLCRLLSIQTSTVAAAA